MSRQSAVGDGLPTLPPNGQAAVENAYQDSGSSPPIKTGVTTPLAPTGPSQHSGADNTLARVASDQRRKGRKSMSRRSGQKGQVVKKGGMWHVRFYVDVAGQEKRQRKSVPIGPCRGKDKLTKPEAERKGAEVIASLGVNTAEHLERAMNLKPVVTFEDRVNWCRRYHKAWTDGKPSSVLSMENQLTKHILPRFGALPLDAIDETAVQEFVADLKRTTFERRKQNGQVIKTYRLSRKTILNIVGVVKLVLGKKVWMSWELDLGNPDEPQQRYFTEEQLKQVINAAEGQYRVLFALLAGTGMRIGEAAGLYVADLDLDNCVIYVRRGVWNGKEQSPKTKKGIRQIDIDPGLADLLRQHLAAKKMGRVFEARNGSPISGANVLKRVLHPILKRLGIPKAGLHAFRHSRVTMLRKRDTPEDLQKLWIGHSSLRTTDRYSHTHEELEYRRLVASKLGLNLAVGPNGPNLGGALAE
jgi:integrase